MFDTVRSDHLANMLYSKALVLFFVATIGTICKLYKFFQNKFFIEPLQFQLSVGQNYVII